MQPTFKTPDEVIKAAFQQAPGFLSADMPQAVKDKAAKIDSYNALVSTLRDEGKVPEDLAQTAASATLFGALEKFGINPEEWKFTVDPKEMLAVKYGSEQWENARRFNATWTDVAQVALFAASVFGLTTAVVGTGLAIGTGTEIAVALRAGKGWSAIKTILEIAKFRGIKWLSIPAFLTAVSTAVGWFANTQLSTTGDLEGYLLQGATRAEQLEARNAAGGVSGFTKSEPASYTRVQTQKTAKPKLFTGTFFSGKLGKFDEFVRQVDDKITSFEDMVDDIEINLKRWYEKLPGMLNYDLVVVNQPKDELGITRTGTWVVCNLYITNSWHKRSLLENILLGPVDPAVYYPDTQAVFSINISIPKILNAQDIEKLDLPKGKEYTIDSNGNVVAGFFGGYGTKIEGGDIVKTAEDILKSSQAVTKAAEAVKTIAPTVQPPPAALADVRIDVGGTERTVPGDIFKDLAERVRNGSMPLENAGKVLNTHIGGVNEFAARAAIAHSVGLSTPDERDYRYGGVPNYSVSAASASPPQATSQPSPSAPPISQGPNFVQPFPRTIVVKVNGLAVRSAPNTGAPLAGSQRLNAGDTFVATALVAGENVEGVNLWWKSQFGNYVWSGGTQ